jgi:hypothetical protein
MTMPESPRLTGEAFAVERLRENPDLDFPAIRKMAGDAGISMAPIQYGRARRQLGLPPLRGPQSAGALARMAPPVLGGSSETDGDDGDGSNDDGEADDSPSDGERDGDTHDHHDAGAAPMANSAASSHAASDMVTPKRKGSAPFDFLMQALRTEPHASYGDLKRRADELGHKIAPIMYGRAKAMLGLVPVKPRGTAKKAKAEAAAAAQQAAPRVLRQVESVAADRFAQKLEEVRNLEQLIAIFKDLDAERRKLRNLLDRIVAMIDEALG